MNKSSLFLILFFLTINTYKAYCSETWTTTSFVCGSITSDHLGKKSSIFLPVMPIASIASSDQTLFIKDYKGRFHWNENLHSLFLDAIEALGGIENTTPTKVLDKMKELNPYDDNLSRLTRQHVATHLQNYRKKEIGGAKRVKKEPRVKDLLLKCQKLLM